MSQSGIITGTFTYPQESGFASNRRGVLVVAMGTDANLELSARNLPQVVIIRADSLNVVDLLNADTLLITQPSLDKMAEVLPEARADMSDFAPRIITIKINPEKIREIIGKGGSMIRKIQEETQTEINVEDDGTVEIAAVSGENSRKAIQWIESLTREVEVGALYLGKVTRIMGFGAFVEILPGKEGLVRIGELADYHVPTVEDVVSVGDEVMVVVTEIDRQGRVNLSRKAASTIARQGLAALDPARVKALRETIEESPPTLEVATESFRVQTPFLARFADAWKQFAQIGFFRTIDLDEEAKQPGLRAGTTVPLMETAVARGAFHERRSGRADARLDELPAPAALPDVRRDRPGG